MRLKKTVFVKEKGRGQALVLDAEAGGIFECSGDMARFLLLLSKHAGSELSSLQKKLAAQSATFKKNKKQRECLKETIAHLQKLGIIDLRKPPPKKANAKKSPARQQL